MSVPEKEDRDRHLEAAKILAWTLHHDVYLVRIGTEPFGRSTTRYAIQVSDDPYRSRSLVTAEGGVFECSQLT